MEPQMNADERRLARTVSIADQVIEDILSKHDDELESFVASDSQQFHSVKSLVEFERARRAAMREQIEDEHRDCEPQNIEKVTTWGYAAAFGFGLGVLYVAGWLLVALIRWIF